jgi:hypothetical protein
VCAKIDHATLVVCAAMVRAAMRDTAGRTRPAEAAAGTGSRIGALAEAPAFARFVRANSGVAPAIE